MALILASDKLCDIISANTDIIPVINRFGIKLGTGDHTIEEVCSTLSLDCEFLLCIINTYINEDYFPEKILKSFCASTIVSYLEKTNSHYMHFQLPNIERHFMSLLARSGDNNNLGVMMRFFNEVKTDITNRISHDSDNWFKEIKSLASGNAPGSGCNIDDSNTILEKLNDLRNLFIIHLNGDYDTNLCYGVIVALSSLEKDIKQNDRIRNRILIPLYRALTNNV